MLIAIRSETWTLGSLVYSLLSQAKLRCFCENLNLCLTNTSFWTFMADETCFVDVCVLNFRRRAWPILWLTASIWVRWLPSRCKLLVLGRLHWPWKAVPWDCVPAACLQNQVPRELFPLAWKSRVRLNQPHLWILRRVQAPPWDQAMENLHRLLQLPAHCSTGGWQNPVHARRPVPRAEQNPDHQ